MPSPTTCKIVREFLTSCPSLELPELWSHIRATSRVRQGPDDEHATLEALRSMFSEEELCQSKIFVRNQDQTLTLPPRLAGAALVPLLGEPDQQPFEIVTQGGCFFGPGLPVCKAVLDEHIQGDIERANNQLCVAFSLLDVAVLLSVGIPAALATGLDQLEHENLLEFCQCFGFQRPGMPALAETPHLLLVGWSPATLEVSQPPELTAVLSYLRKVHEYLGFGLEEIYVWQPADTDIDRLKFCLRHGGQLDINQAMVDSMDNSVQAPFMPPQQDPKEQKAAPADLSTVLAQVHDARCRTQNGDIPRQVWQDFERRLHHDVIAPLLQQAMAEQEPVRRNLLTAFADFSRLLHAQAFLIYEKLSRAACGGEKTASGPLPQTDFQQLLALSDRFLLLAKECHPWNKKPRSTKSKTPKALGSSTTSASAPRSARP